jgi:hypothetical protein
MTEIKLIGSDEDLRGVSLQPLDWDLVVNGSPYDVYRVPGFVHTVGGSFVENDIWCCPMGQKPCARNLAQFDGSAPTWGIEVSEMNRVKVKWGEVKIREAVRCVITRNGMPFYEVGAGNLDYALSKARSALTEIQEGPVDVFTRDWDKKLVGRKVYYNGAPAVVTAAYSGSSVVLIPDGATYFPPPIWAGAEDLEFPEFDAQVKIDILDRNVWWFREEDDGREKLLAKWREENGRLAKWREENGR